MRYFRSPYKQTQSALLLIDLVFVAVMLALATFVGLAGLSVIFYAVWLIAFLVTGYIFGAYDLLAQPGQIHGIRQALLIVALCALVSSPFVIGPIALRVSTVVVLAACFFGYLIWSRQIVRRRQRGRGRIRTTIFVHSDQAVRRLGEISAMVEQYHDTTVVDLGRGLRPEGHWPHNDSPHRPDLVVFEPTVPVLDTLGGDLVRGQAAGVRVVDLIDFYATFTGRIPLDLVDDYWLLENYRATRWRVMYNRTRRSLDIALGALLLLVCLVPLLVLALVVVATSRGPAIFRQKRLGRFRRPFMLFKLRTMRADAEHGGPQWAQPNDPRVTPIGWILRESHLDELPQLWNLLSGDITLIGPRPIRAHFADELSGVLPRYELRFLAKPGLTGWSQVLGPYGANVDEHRIKLEMDLYYIHNANFVLDAYILVRTVRVVLSGRPG